MERYSEAERCYKEDQDLLDQLEYPGDLTSLLDGYDGIEVQGAGPVQSYSNNDRLLKCRMLSSHLKNENCLLFAFFGPHRKRFLSRYKMGTPYSFKNCVIVVEETSDLNWLAAIPMGMIQFENCVIYKVQDYMFRAFARLPLKLEYAIPWAVGAGSRLVVFLKRMGLAAHIQSISSCQYCWQAQRYDIARAKGVAAEETELTIEYENGVIKTHADYIQGNIFLRAFLKDIGIQPTYESELNLFGFQQLMNCVNSEGKISLPVWFELEGKGEIQFQGEVGTSPQRFQKLNESEPAKRVFERADGVIEDLT